MASGLGGFILGGVGNAHDVGADVGERREVFELLGEGLFVDLGVFGGFKELVDDLGVADLEEELLELAGRAAFSIEGGTKAWQAAGLPVVTGGNPT